MRTTSLTLTTLETVRKDDKLRADGNVVAPMSGSLFTDMLEHVRPLLSGKHGTSEWQIKDHFRNLQAHVVEMFLSIAIRRGIIKEAFGTYTL